MCGGAHDETKRRGELRGEAHVSPTGVSSHLDASKAHPVLVRSQEWWPRYPGPEDEFALPGPSAGSQKPQPGTGGAARDGGAKALLRSTRQCCEQSGDVLRSCMDSWGPRGQDRG